MTIHEDWKPEQNGRAAQPAAGGNHEIDDEDLREVLSDFRLSAHAWGDAELTRPRTAIAARRGLSWRLAAGWALGCALLVGGASGALYERHHLAEAAKIRAALEAEQQRQLALHRETEEEDLLARVDSDVAREVPSAMEPLAQLMDADETK